MTTTIYQVTEGDLGKRSSIPIGKPISNTRALVLGQHGQLQPVGVAGRLYIAGEGVSLGYVNRQALTDERFIDSPLLAGEKAYDTGDVVKLLPDGELTYLSRSDQQVKLRGFRIELGEVESAINRVDGVSNAVVTLYKKHGDGALVAYYVGREKLTVEQFKERLDSLLPNYMIPSMFMKVDEIPLNSNGKADVKALPTPYFEEGEIVAAETATEKALVTIWAEVLMLKPGAISTVRSFFDMGGHSLKAAFLVNNVNDAFNVEVSLKAFYLRPTIQHLASHIDQLDKTSFKGIPVAEEELHYPLTAAQRRLYFMYELDNSSLAYNVTQTFKLKGKIELQRLKEALAALVTRHESLRTTIAVIDGEPRQVVHENLPFQFDIYEDAEECLNEFVRSFDISTGPLFRAGFAWKNGEEALLQLDMHHIITDGVSQDILISEFITLYNGGQLPALRLQFKDYAVWQESEAYRDTVKLQKEFWLEKYETIPELLDLPYDHVRPTVPDYKGSFHHFLLDKHELDSLREIARKQNTTMYSVTLSLYYLLLSGLSGKQDLSVGTVVSGRSLKDVEQMNGMFVNTLPLRQQVDHQQTFADFVHQTGLEVLSYLENQSYPFEELLEELHIERDISRNPLFDTMFSYQKSETYEANLTDLEVIQAAGQQRAAQFDLSVEIGENADELAITFHYATALFDPETIAHFGRYMKQLIRSVVERPDIPLSEIRMLTPEEENSILSKLAGPVVEVPREKNLVDLFEASVAETPNHVAIVFHDQEISYLELDKRANQLANHLIANELAPGEVVGLLLERGISQFVSILAVLKAGAAYMPIHKDYPTTRRQLMCEENKVKLIISDSSDLQEELPQQTIINPLVDMDGQTAYDSAPVVTMSPDAIAYIIYTSGSTGKPKGVQALHRNVVNLAHAQRQRYNLQPQERILQFSTIAFDASVEQTWLALLFSNTLVLVDELTITDSQALSRYIIDQEITHFNATPSYLEQVHFPDQHQLRRIVMGGEACSVQLAKRLITEASLYNSYGPTETTVTSVVHQVTESDVTSGSSIPIGRPIGNTNLLILGTNGEILPYGVPGKLFIAGDGVTRGYVDRPALNDERFISSPLLKGAKTYDSGDVVKLMADGRLIYVSRSDQQVKLRGFRIELGEIEHAIAQVKGVSRSVVVLHKEDHGDALVAYYVGEQKLSIEELREQLTALIPAYMIPSMLIKIDQIPLNSNGKVDFRALPAPYYDEGEVTLPATATEEAVVVIWAEVLKLSTEVISTTRSFFDLGGHSLKAAYLVNRVNEAFQVEVSLRDFFLFPDVKNLSAFIDSLEYTEVYSLSKAAIQPHYPLTSAQKRLYFIHTMDSYSLAYNVTQAFVLKGHIDQQKLKYTFTRLVERHESLMTSIKVVDGEPRQFIQQQPDFSFEVYDDAEACMTQFVRPFDLSQGPLFRVGFAMKGEGEALLHLDMHHIITDGISQNVLISEFIRLYNGDQLAEPELQFKDYAVWQQSNDYQKRVERQKRFWLEKYDSLPDALQLPYDHTRPEVPDYQGAYHHFVIEQEQVMRLREIAVKEQTTLYAVTLSLYYLLLARLGNQEDVVVGTPVGGRELKDIEQMNGMFVNTLPLRQQIDYQMSFSDLVAKTGADVFFSMANQAYPFEELLEELKIARDIGRNPLFDTMFSYRNTEDAIPKLDNLEVIPVSSDQNLAQFDLSVDVGEEPAGLVVTMEYATSVFEQATIERFAGYFQQIVNAVVENADVRLSAIDLLTAQEKSTLLRQLSGKKFPIPQGENLVSLFETSVDGNPDGVALVYHETQLTYQQFDEKANQIANYLIEGGVKPGDSVGLFQERGIDQLASMLAILKAGAAYLPIHKQYPESRRQLMLEENQVKILLTDEGDLGHKLSDLKVINPIKEIDFSKADTNRPGIHIPTDSLSYILYTSGSTGKPKGVQVMHKGVVNMVMALREFYELQDQERLLQFSTIAFDASVEQIWLAFSTGNTLVLIDELTIGDSKEFVHYITRHQLTHIDATPTFLDQLHIPDENRLRRIVAGGEVLTLALAERLSHKAQVYNAYGPTETTVTATVHKVSHADIDKGKGVPIGQPIGNTSALVLGKHGQVQPYGVPGRLYIAGAGVSKGYVNRPALTNERFITHHLVAEGKVYDTGDIATLQPDGRLMYQSRSDQQVKLRGFRIELGEIESAMISLDKVTSAVVTLYEKNGDSALVAWYVSTARISSEQLKERLQDHLPSFMIPSILMKVDKIPLNSSGKAAISALPSPYFERGEVTLAETETEMTLVELWSQVLKIDADDISTTRSFFDLGGHSLKVAQLKHEITNSLGYEVSVVQLFQYQTIREQAKLVGQNDRSDAQNNDQHLILALNEIKEGAPALFFIHDGSGDVLGYKKLATVMQEYNCWGIRSATLSYAGPVEMTVQQLAKRYIELIRGVQPAGALSVVGWSLGGSIAYEIARQLESSGDQLNHLVMIDTDFFCETFRETGSSQHFGFAEELKLVSNIGMSLSKDQIAEITDAEMLWSRLIDKLRGSQTLFAQFKKYLPEDVKALIPFWNEHKADELVRLCNTIRSLTYAVSTYQSTGKVSAPAAYLSASQTDLNLSDLDEHFGQQVTIMTIQASHFNILKQPQLHQTVKVMRNYLTQPKTTVLQDNMNK